MDNKELTPINEKSYHGNMDDNVEKAKPAQNETTRVIEMINKFEGIARGGLVAYAKIRPVSEWKDEDFARAIFALGPGAEREEQAKELKQKLIEAAEVKAKAKGEESKIYEKMLELESKQDSKGGKGRLLKQESWDKASDEDKAGDSMRREIIANLELWNELVSSRKVQNLSGGQLKDYWDYWFKMSLIVRYDTESFKEVSEVMTGISSEENRRTKDNVAKFESQSKGLGGSENGKNGGNGGNGGGGNGEGGGQNGGGPRDYTKETAENTASMAQTLINIEAAVDEIKNTINNIYAKMQQSDYDKKQYEVYQKQLIEQDDRLRTLAQKKAERLRQFEYERGRGQIPEEDKLAKEPWKKTDRELFVGNIDEVLEERMMRIAYLNAKSKGLEGAAIAESDPFINPDTKGISDRDRARRADFLQRMEVVYKEMNDSGSMLNEQRKYMIELKRWVRTIENNSQFGGGKLKISNEAYKDFKEVLATKTRVFECGEDSDSEKEKEKKFQEGMIKAVDLLKKQHFLDYFRQIRIDELGVPELKQFGYREGKTGDVKEGGVPNSLWETLGLITHFYRSEGYDTGEEHQLIDENGKFVFNNFWYFILTRMAELSDRVSQNPINTLQQVTLQTTYTNLPLAMILDVPNYTLTSNFEMVGDATNPDTLKKGQIEMGWGKPQEIPEFSYDNRETLKKWTWNFDWRHNDGVSLFVDNTVRLDRGEWVKAFNDIVKRGDWYRRGYFALWAQMPSSKGEEMQKYFEKNEQGSLGAAGIAALVFYQNLTSFTDFYMERNKDGKATGVREVDKNTAYTAMGMDGAAGFLLNLAENGLTYSSNAEIAEGNEFKKQYREHAREVIQQIERDVAIEIKAKNKGEEDFKKRNETLGFLVKKYIDILDSTPEGRIVIGFNTAKVFESNKKSIDVMFDLQREIDTLVMGRGLVNDEEAAEWQGPKDRIVTRSEIRKNVRQRMRNSIMDYFDRIKGVDIETENENGKIEKQKLGNVVIHLDRKGRIVNRTEWKDLGHAKDDTSDKTTIGRIMDEFKDFGEFDELNFGAEYKRLYDEYKKSHDDKEPDPEYFKQKLGKYYKNIERNERLGVALVTKVANIERKKLNWMSQTQPPDRTKDIVRRSLRGSLRDIYGLVGSEELVLDDGSFYSLEPLLIAAKNNTSNNVKVNQGTWWLRTSDVWNQTRGVQPKSGLLGEIKALAPGTVLDMINVSRPGEKLPGEKGARTLLEEFQGGTGATMKERVLRNISGDRLLIDSARESLQTIFNRMLSGHEFIKLLYNEDVMSFHDIMKQDPYFPGRLVFDPNKAVQATSKWWTPIKDIYNKTETNYKRKIVYEGKEMTVEQYMFGDKILNSKELLKQAYRDKGTWAGDEVGKIYDDMAEKLDETPGMAVIAFMAANTIYEHSDLLSGLYEKWDLEQIDEFINFLDEFLTKPIPKKMKDGRVEYVKGPTQMPFHVLDQILRKTKNRDLKNMELLDFFWALITAFTKGTFIEAPKEIGEAYLGAVQPIRAVS